MKRLLMFSLLALSATVQAQIPKTLSYQGVFSDTSGVAKADGIYSFTFSLYDAASGGAPLWTETKNLQVTRGLFSTLLGDVTPFGGLTFTEPYWLGITPGSDPELDPRVQLSAVPYSLTALAADSARIASKVSLPFSGTVSIPGTALSVVNSTGSGIYGEGSVAIEGYSTGGIGVYGSTESATGTGVWGKAYALSGFNYGVFGESESSAGFGGFFSAYSGSGETYGVYARSLSTTGVGVRGLATSSTGSGYGVYGTSASLNGIGVYGFATSSSGTNFGVYGATSSSTGFAGYFNGRVEVAGNFHVSGTLSKFAGSFTIDHPLDPANKLLSHSFVESPDMMNIYNGNVGLDANGAAEVLLPEWFEALNRDFRYQLTCIGGFAPVYVATEIEGNKFTIAGGTPGMKVSWQVTGVRKDAYANQHRIKVEEEKTGEERGKYLNPEAFGKSNDHHVSPVPRDH